MQIILCFLLFNAVGVAFLIAQGCQAIAQATLGWHMVCGEQRRRCCAFSTLPTMDLLAITILSQKKLNTYGVESPRERLPGVGSFLANPGLSKEQLVPSCIIRVFLMEGSFIENLL